MCLGTGWKLGVGRGGTWSEVATQRAHVMEGQGFHRRHGLEDLVHRGWPAPNQTDGSQIAGQQPTRHLGLLSAHSPWGWDTSCRGRGRQTPIWHHPLGTARWCWRTAGPGHVVAALRQCSAAVSGLAFSTGISWSGAFLEKAAGGQELLVQALVKLGKGRGECWREASQGLCPNLLVAIRTLSMFPECGLLCGRGVPCGQVSWATLTAAANTEARKQPRVRLGETR